MRKALVGLLACGLAGAAPPAGAMDMFGGASAIRPEADFQAVVVDRDGTEVRLERVNVNGRVALPGRLGRGEVRVPFGSIRSIEFRTDGGGHTLAEVHLAEGEPVILSVRDSLRIYGQTRLGLYEIRARDVRRLEFRPAADGR